MASEAKEEDLHQAQEDQAQEEEGTESKHLRGLESTSVEQKAGRSGSSRTFNLA